MKPKHKRLLMVIAGLAVLSITAAFVFYNFRQNLVFFYTPSDISEQHIQPGKHIRLGGLVLENSLKHIPDTTTIEFKITDMSESIDVIYTGIVPDLFREGQGVVAEGHLLDNGTFEATTLLAKHDENYMPPEVAKALGERGIYRHYEN